MTRRQPWTLAGLIGIAVLAGAASAADRFAPVVLINESPSLPRGLYRHAAGDRIAPGAIVAVRQPPSARPYLQGLGMPDRVLLLKRVVAVGGEDVCAKPGRVRTPRRTVEVRDRDRRGMAMKAWRGCRLLTADEVFVLGDTEASYDSRYFGPVSRDAVVGVYREMRTW